MNGRIIATPERGTDDSGIEIKKTICEGARGPVFGCAFCDKSHWWPHKYHREDGREVIVPLCEDHIADIYDIEPWWEGGGEGS